MIKKLSGIFILLTAALTILFLTGCGERERETPQTGEDTTAIMEGETDTTSQMEDSLALNKEVEIPDITGTWTGKLDAHNSTLRITEQNGLSFKGRISTNFREVLNQEIAGEFDPETRTLKMRDTYQARNMGTYTAKLSEDMSSMTGTFTITHDKKNFSFNYRKQQ